MAKKNILTHPLMIMLEVFIALTILALLARNYLESRGADLSVVLTGNLILFLIGVFTLRKSLKAIEDPNPHAFVRSFYAGFLIRLAVIAAAAFIYIYSQDGKVNRIALFICMGIYAVYSIVEVSSLRKVLSGRKNA